MTRAWILLAVFMLAGNVLPAQSAVAPTNAPSGFAPQICESAYAPKKQRDPFLRTDRVVTPAAATGTPVLVQAPKREIQSSWFRLQAMLRDRRNPVAVINGELLELNKPVIMRVGGSDYAVKAVEIGSNRVVLDVEGQRVEVRLEEAAAPPKPK